MIFMLEVRIIGFGFVATCRLGHAAIEFGDEVGASDALETLLDASALLGLVPEEILALGKFVALALSAEDGLEGVGVVACVPGLCGDGHWGGGEVLHLLEVEVELLGDDGELGHILLLATGMAADEVGDDLLAQVLLAVDAVEDALELVELLERGLAHESQHAFAGMFRGYLQAPRNVAADEFVGVLLCGTVALLVLAAMEQQVVTHTAADETPLDAWQCIDSVVDVE